MRKLSSSFATALVGGCVLFGCSGSDHVVVHTISNRTGLGMPGIRVQVADQAWATTDDKGAATFSSVEGTFTVRGHQNLPFRALPFDNVFVLEGQNVRDVTVEVDGNPGTLAPGTHLPGWYDASISGSVQGRTQPPSAATTVAGVFYNETWLGSVVAQDGTFDAGIIFQAPATSVNVRAYEGLAGSIPGTLTELYAVGSSTAPVSNGGHATGVSISLQPATRGMIDATASLAAPLAGASVLAFSTVGFGRYEPVAFFGTTGVTPAAFSMPVFAAAGAHTSVTLFTQGSAAGSARHTRRVSVPQTGVAFQLRAPLDLVQPADGATIDPSTVFSWSGSTAGGSSTLAVTCSLATSIVTYAVTTTASQATLPTVPDIALPSGTSCGWSVSWNSATDPAVEQFSSTSASRSATVR